MNEFFEKYFTNYHKVLSTFLTDHDNKHSLERVISLLLYIKKTNTSTLYLIGNGGSSAIAEHMAIDFTKNAGLRALAISGSPMLTTFANDYGYEYVFQKAIERFAREGDILMAISSSGASKNILNACATAKNKNMKIITFSGFDKNNPLRNCGTINFWVNSKSYGYVEMIHNLLIHYINDAIIGSSEY